MSGRAEQALANALAFGLSGFNPQRPDKVLRPSEQPAASPVGARGRAAMAIASRAGVSGFPHERAATQPVSARVEAILALGGRIGLAGFERRVDACDVAAGDSAADTVATATRLRLPGFGDHAKAAPTLNVARAALPAATPAAQPPSPVGSPAAQPTKPLTKQPFALITIAAGGAAAFASLETKMGMPFASSFRGQTSWLQRDQADGGQIRAYPLRDREATSLRKVAGPLGTHSVRLSVAGIARSDFAVRSSGCDKPGRSPLSVLYVDAGVPAALHKALGR